MNMTNFKENKRKLSTRDQQESYKNAKIYKM